MISRNNNRITTPLAVTMGDPAGIGLEIILKSYQKRTEYSLPPFVIFGCPNALEERARLLNINCKIRIVNKIEGSIASFTNELPVLPIPTADKVVPGKPNKINSKAIIESVTLATKAVIDDTASAIVTCPISKAVLSSYGFSYPGHTEFLAHLAETFYASASIRPVMMLVSENLRVVPVTIHIPISDVPLKLSAPIVEETIMKTWQSLKDDFAIQNPVISVAGLNPHAGESGTIGREELEIIKPIVEKLHSCGLNVNGPYSADSLFIPKARSSYDAVICMYHDQALIPFKTIDFDTGVNFTLGLPFVRTSPDHGTAFEIAHLGIASPTSFISALKLANDISQRRQQIITS